MPMPCARLLAVLAVLLTIAGCHELRPAGDSQVAIPIYRRILPPDDAQRMAERLCSSIGTYERLKIAAFRQAARVRGNDSAPFDRLAAYATVRIEEPLVVASEQGPRLIRCTARMAIDLPPGTVSLSGARSLATDVAFTGRPAADGTALVWTLSSAEPIVYSLATLRRKDGDEFLPPPIVPAAMRSGQESAPAAAAVPQSVAAVAESPRLPTAPLPAAAAPPQAVIPPPRAVALPTPAPSAAPSPRPKVKVAQAVTQPEARPRRPAATARIARQAKRAVTPAQPVRIARVAKARASQPIRQASSRTARAAKRAALLRLQQVAAKRVAPARVQRVAAKRVAPARVQRLAAKRAVATRVQRVAAKRAVATRVQRAAAKRVAPARVQRVAAKRVAPPRVQRVAARPVAKARPRPVVISREARPRLVRPAAARTLATQSAPIRRQQRADTRRPDRSGRDGLDPLAPKPPPKRKGIEYT